MHNRVSCLLFALVYVNSGCADAPSPRPAPVTCVAGVEYPCVCPGGAVGALVCLADGTRTSCAPCVDDAVGADASFADPPPRDVGPADATSGASGDAGAPDSAPLANDGSATAHDTGGATAPDTGVATGPDAGVARTPDTGVATAADGGGATAADTGVATAADGGGASAADSGDASAADGGGASAADGGGASVPDAGPPADATTPDGGSPGAVDAGLPPSGCAANQPGCRCTPGATPQGSCVDPTNTCRHITGAFAFCERACVADADCVGQNIGGVRPAPLCRGNRCVEEEASDDEACRTHALSWAPVAGCRPGASCVAPGSGYPIGHGVCAQLCAPTAADPNGGCPAAMPYCNPRVLSNGSAQVGLCSVARLDVGARCRGGQSFTQRCDTRGSASLVCVSNDLVDAWPGLPLDEGFCLELCDPTQPVCSATSDPAIGPGTCVNIGVGSSGQPLGLCSHECDVVPNNCSGAGVGAGQHCEELGLPTSGGGPSRVALCTDVQTPVLSEARVRNLNGRPAPIPGVAFDSCEDPARTGAAHQCEQHTACLAGFGSPSSPDAACVRLCTPTAAAPPYDVNECAGSPHAGSVCVPLANVPGANVGFCTPQP